MGFKWIWIKKKKLFDIQQIEIGGRNHYYHKYIFWRCVAFGAQLASITSEKEYNLIKWENLVLGQGQLMVKGSWNGMPPQFQEPILG